MKTSNSSSLYSVLLNVLLPTLVFSLFVVQIPKSEGNPPTTEIKSDDLDTFIAGQMLKNGVKGISIAVMPGTEIIYLKGFGTAGR